MADPLRRMQFVQRRAEPREVVEYRTRDGSRCWTRLMEQWDWDQVTARLTYWMHTR